MNADQPDRASGTGSNRGPGNPRALIHKKVLDVADANPTASTEDLADAVSGASATFVERVLDEYGDPANEDRESHSVVAGGEGAAVQSDTESTDLTGDESGPTESGDEDARADRSVEEGGSDDDLPEDPSVADDPNDTNHHSTTSSQAQDAEKTATTTAERDEEPSLSDKQRETLLAVASRPTATQAKIADELDVSRATVSKRLNTIDGFQWATRRDFVTEYFDYRGGGSTGTAVGSNGHGPGANGGAGDSTDRLATDGNSRSEQFDRLEATVEALEQTVDGLAEHLDELEADGEARSGGSATALSDPELVHKIVRACMDAEYVDTEEELQVIREFVTGD